VINAEIDPLQSEGADVRRETGRSRGAGDRAYYLVRMSGMKQRQLEKLAANEDSLFQGYSKGDGTLDLGKLSEADDVHLKIMFAGLPNAIRPSGHTPRHAETRLILAGIAGQPPAVSPGHQIK